MSRKLSTIGEFGLIDLIARNLTGNARVIQGIGDDAAVLRSSRGAHSSLLTLFTTDMLLEGAHFTRSMGAKAIGHKALACNLSDIAAMGGWPTFAVVSLGVPANLDVSFVRNIYAGINALAQKFKVAIVGGDTVKSQKIIINIALLGEVGKNQVVYRSGAKAGDLIFITGPLGRSLQTDKHLTFTPRVAESQWLVRNFKPTAMIDISDGLLADLGHILTSSQVGAQLNEVQIPKTKGATLKQALSDGEDFELLFTLNPSQAKQLQNCTNPFRFYPIGQIVAKNKDFTMVNTQGKVIRLSQKGFKHF